MGYGYYGGTVIQCYSAGGDQWHFWGRRAGGDNGDGEMGAGIVTNCYATGVRSAALTKVSADS